MKRLLLLPLFLIGCSAKPAAEDAKPTALVTTAAAERGAAADTVTAYGAAEFLPEGERSLTAPIEAVVASNPAPAGSQVRAGEPVVVLAPSPATRLEVDKAAHEAEEADAAYARAQRLRATGLDSDADVETARAAAATADATRRSVTARTGDALILRAPMAGVVESLALARGDLAAAGAAVAKIGDPKALRARLGLEPEAAGAVHVGGGVRVSLASGGPETSLQVMAVDPRADAQTRLASISVQLPPGRGFSPGQPLRGVVVLGERAGAVLIPRAAVLYEQDRPYGFVAVGGKAHKVELTLGAEQGDKVEVVKGVDPGARVIVEGAAALEDGMKVREASPAEPRS